MKKIYIIVFLFMLKMSFLSAQGSTGIVSNEKVTIVSNGIATDYPTFNDGHNNNFGNQNFGNFILGSTSTLVMKMPYFNYGDPCTSTNATFSYRIYNTSTTTPSMTSISLIQVTSSPTVGTWLNSTTSIDVLASALTIGSYNIEIQFQYTVPIIGMVCFQGYNSGIYTATFTVSNPTLAVEMSKFTARKQNNKEIAILWKTGQEKANKSFIIERSSDGLTFSKIGSMQGSENSVVEKAYNFTDVAPLQGVNYYRLTSVDAQGKETTSKIVSVNFSDKLSNKLQIYPNPAHSALQIELISDEESTKTVQVFDLVGRIILSQNALLTKGLNNILLDVNAFSSGTYLVKMCSEMSRFVKF
jgi:Secretion system C-terminal sorting domain